MKYLGFHFVHKEICCLLLCILMCVLIFMKIQGKEEPLTSHQRLLQTSRLSINHSLDLFIYRELIPQLPDISIYEYHMMARLGLNYIIHYGLLLEAEVNIGIGPGIYRGYNFEKDPVTAGNASGIVNAFLRCGFVLNGELWEFAGYSGIGQRFWYDYSPLSYDRFIYYNFIPLGGTFNYVQSSNLIWGLRIEYYLFVNGRAHTFRSGFEDHDYRQNSGSGITISFPFWFRYHSILGINVTLKPFLNLWYIGRSNVIHTESGYWVEPENETLVIGLKVIY